MLVQTVDWGQFQSSHESEPFSISLQIKSSLLSAHKVYLNTIHGYVASEILKCISAFINMCYIICHGEVTESTLTKFQAVLKRFLLRSIVRSNVRPKCGNNSVWESPRVSISDWLRPNVLWISVIVNATPKAIDVIDLALFEFELDGQSPEVVTANQRAYEVRVRGKGWEPRHCYYQVIR